MTQSPAERLALLTPSQQIELLEALSAHQAQDLLYDWRGFNARPEQIAPPDSPTDWDIWLTLAGRGYGKTRLGAEWIRERIKQGAKRIALIAETQKDLEEVMVNGESGIMSIFPASERPIARFKPLRLTFPSGAIALGYNATEPDQLRGPQFDTAWGDEVAKWRYARETWDMLQFGMRLGDKPRVCLTTTPRPIDLLKDMLAGKEGKIMVSRGPTSDNYANLAPNFVAKLTKRYGGTRLGRQELDAEMLSDMPGALWSMDKLDMFRVTAAEFSKFSMGRTLVGVDPAVTSGADSNEHGIIVAGMTGRPNEAAVLADRSMSGKPLEWARAAISAYDEFEADAVVVEINQGGQMVAQTLRSVRATLPIIEVRASKGKHVRAEPIAALYEQGRVRHVGTFSELEAQMTQMTQSGYQGDNSPDRVDALVWVLSSLFPAVIEREAPRAPPVIIPMRHYWGR